MTRPDVIRRRAPEALETALAYHRRGWRVLPLPVGSKRATARDWPLTQHDEAQLTEAFQQCANLGLILGEPSGWLVDVDLDCEEAVAWAAEYLPATGLVSGRARKPRSHWWYIAHGAASEQHKDPHTGQMLLELRSTGRQTVVGPSQHPEGDVYDVLDGEPAHVPAPLLTLCVRALAQRIVEARHGTPIDTAPPACPPLEPVPSPSPHDVEARALAYLDRLPPAISGAGGHSATYTAATVLVHGFEIDPDRALTLLLDHYNPRCEPPWSERELQHKVDDAASKPHDRPRGWLLHAVRDTAPAAAIDLAGLVTQAHSVALASPPPSTVVPPCDVVSPDPGPIPEELLCVPGFVDDVMRFTLDTAPYPNRVLAFVGALALLGTLTGRKVREPGNVRTNVQILALASSGVGKDWPRKVNASILLQADETRKLAGKSASGEGIEDRLIGHPVILKQDDEIDTLFENMRDNKEARYRNQFGMLLELFGEAGGWRAIRDRAGEKPGLIYQPHLVLFGTTTPGEFYGSLSGKMLNKGLLARLITAEAGERGCRKRPDWREPPDRIIAVAKEWSKFRPPGWGNLSDESCGQATPLVVPFTDEAQQTLDAFADRCDEAYRAAAKFVNEPVMAIWARAVEKATQLALIYACSAHGVAPVIERDAVTWSSAFIEHTIRRTIHMLDKRFHESEFEMKCQAVMETLTTWRKQHGDEGMSYRDITRKHRWPRREHETIRDTLVDQELITTDVVKTAGRPRFVYLLKSGRSDGSP